MENLLWLAPAAGALALAFALLTGAWIGRQDVGTKRMREIADAIHEGAMAFLKREYSVLVIFVAILFVLLVWLIDMGTAVSFLAGAIASVLAGYIGMSVATRANVRTANAAQHGTNRALGLPSAAAPLWVCRLLVWVLLVLVFSISFSVTLRLSMVLP